MSISLAYDATAQGSVAGAPSLTFAHTCTGSNRILVVGVNVSNTSITVSGVTYAGTSMTQITSQDVSTPATRIYLFYLVAPSTGANNVVISTSSSATITASSVSYTGAKQSAQPDASVKAAASSVSLSVVGSRCWIVSTAGAEVGGGVNFTAGSGFTLRQTVNNGGHMNGLEDSNGTVSSGANTVAFGITAGSVAAVIAASIAPAPETDTLTAAVGTFVLTGNVTVLQKLKNIIGTVATFILTGFTATITAPLDKWRPQNKSSTTWTSQNKS